MYSSTTKLDSQFSSIPLVSPEEHMPLDAGHAENKTSKAPGWRKGIIWCTVPAAAILIINTIFLIVAVAKVGTSDGVRTLYEGKCENISRLDSGLHGLYVLSHFKFHDHSLNAESGVP